MGSRGSRPPRAAAADDTGNPTPEIRGTKLSWMPCSLLGVLWSGYQKRLQFGAGAQLCSSCEGPSSHVLIVPMVPPLPPLQQPSGGSLLPPSILGSWHCADGHFLLRFAEMTKTGLLLERSCEFFPGSERHERSHRCDMYSIAQSLVSCLFSSFKGESWSALPYPGLPAWCKGIHTTPNTGWNELHLMATGAKSGSQLSSSPEVPESSTSMFVPSGGVPVWIPEAFAVGPIQW
eukprot:gene7916-biopygen7589